MNREHCKYAPSSLVYAEQRLEDAKKTLETSKIHVHEVETEASRFRESIDPQKVPDYDVYEPVFSIMMETFDQRLIFAKERVTLAEEELKSAQRYLSLAQDEAEKSQQISKIFNTDQ